MMPVAVHYVEPGGAQIKVEGEPGHSAMEVAVAAGVDGIIGECGGACSCATCHVQVDPAWQHVVGRATPAELDLLELSDHLAPNSRLSCQIRLRPEMDGVILRIPPEQG